MDVCECIGKSTKSSKMMLRENNEGHFEKISVGHIDREKKELYSLKMWLWQNAGLGLRLGIHQSVMKYSNTHGEAQDVMKDMMKWWLSELRGNNRSTGPTKNALEFIRRGLGKPLRLGNVGIFQMSKVKYVSVLYIFQGAVKW